MVYNNGTNVEGYWHDGLRYRSYLYYQFSQIFDHSPSSSHLSQDVLYNEENLGPFLFEKYVDEGLIILDAANEI